MSTPIKVAKSGFSFTNGSILGVRFSEMWVNVSFMPQKDRFLSGLTNITLKVALKVN